ncbi:hypothetical protein U1Q18_048642 [Sarracenia purpurea var. burkii]
MANDKNSSGSSMFVDMDIMPIPHKLSSNVHRNTPSASTFPNDRNSHATNLSVHETSPLDAAVSDHSADVSDHSAASSDSSLVPITKICPPESLPVKPVHPMLTRSKCGVVKPKVPLSLLVTKSAFVDTV